MKIFADYHTHTIHSHGKGTIRDNVEAARKKGLKEIAITDHGPGHFLFGVKKENLFKIRKEIDDLNKEFSDIKVLMGLEANIIGHDGSIDVDDEIISLIDILLVGFHFGAKPVSIKDAYYMFGLNYIGKFSEKVSNKAKILNTEAVINAINRYDIKLITHPGDKVDIDTLKLAKAAAKRGTALEINSSHGHLNVEYLKIAMKCNVNFIINSDAHKPNDIGNVENGIKTARLAGLSSDRILNAKD